MGALFAEIEGAGVTGSKAERLSREIHGAMPWDVPTAFRFGELYRMIYLHAKSIVCGMDSLSPYQWDRLGRHYVRQRVVTEFRQDWVALPNRGYRAGWRPRTATPQDGSLLIRVNPFVQLSPQALQLWTFPTDLSPWHTVWAHRLAADTAAGSPGSAPPLCR